MKTYQCHKIVKAVKCSSVVIAENLHNGEIALKADDGNNYVVVDNIFARGEPRGAFYIVEYEGGYRSWSPAEAFEKGYSLLDEEQEEQECCEGDTNIPISNDEYLRQRCLEITNPGSNAWYRITEAEAMLSYIKSGKIPETPSGAAIGGIGGYYSGALHPALVGAVTKGDLEKERTQQEYEKRNLADKAARGGGTLS